MERDRVHRGGIWDRSNVKPDTDHIKNPKQREQQVVRILDNIGFNWTVFIAVSSGFLASSYIIFSSNIIDPALQYVYPVENHNFGEPGLTIDMVTIGTTTLGMLVFGHLADRLGRKRLYGLELFTIIIGTVGTIQSSDGYSAGDEKTHSLSVYATTAAWRGIQGLGIGAEYPLSAIIAAEYASTQTRGTLMAAMFAMQSLGRVLAYVVALGALSSIAEDSFDHRIEVDRIWRLVVGIGAVPALLAIGLRLTIPETPRYYAGIERNLKKAVRAVEKVGGKPDDLQSIHSDVVPTRGGDLDRSPPWISSAWNYLFGPTKAWKSLLGISVLWFLLDVAFYGLGLDSPSTLHRLWMPHPPDPVTNYTYTSMAPVTAATSFSTATLTLERSITTTITELFITAAPTAEPSSTPVTVTRVLSTNLPWNPDQDDRCATIADSLKTTAIRTLLLSSIASGIGSIAAIAVINYFSRRRLMSVTSDILCLLFFASGFSVWCATETPANEVSMVLFALTQFVFNLGPNTLTFIIAAESFPTVFRGTFYGIEVASGKLGALLIRPVMHSIKDDDDSLMGVLFGFCGVTLSMAGASLVPGWMVDIQHPRTRRGETSLQKAERGRTGWLLEPLRSRTLEEIAPNPHSQEKERTGNAPDIMEEGKGIETTGNVDSAV